MGKRASVTGKVRVTKTVRERTAVIDEPLAADVVTVDRVPIDRFVEGPIPTATRVTRSSSPCSKRSPWSRNDSV